LLSLLLCKTCSPRRCTLLGRWQWLTRPLSTCTCCKCVPVTYRKVEAKQWIDNCVVLGVVLLKREELMIRIEYMIGTCLSISFTSNVVNEMDEYVPITCIACLWWKSTKGVQLKVEFYYPMNANFHRTIFMNFENEPVFTRIQLWIFG
jgi:hypothetical protein